MKYLKKFASLALALVMVLALAAPAFAADTKLEIAPNSGHVYTLYQLFQADGKDESSLDESTIKWGSGINTAKLGDMWNALVAAFPTKFTGTAPGNFTTDEGAKSFAELLKTGFDPGGKEESVEQTALLVKTILGVNGLFTYEAATLNDATLSDTVPTGYYLIKDQVGTQDPDPAYMAWIIGTFAEGKSLTVTPKKGTTEVNKKVKVPVPETTEDESADKWEDAAIYSAVQGANNQIEFKITIKVPSDIKEDKYNNENGGYNITLHDTQDNGLTFGQVKSVKLYSQSGSLRQENVPYTNKVAGGTATLEHATCTFELEIPNVQNLTDIAPYDYIEVIYTASYNDRTVTGTAGNNNKVELYVNGKKEGEDNAKVFELQFVVDKIDGDGVALSGAEFGLFDVEADVFVLNNDGEPLIEGNKVKFKENANKTPTIALTETKNEANGTVTRAYHTTKDLVAGDHEYWLVETKTPEGYNVAKPIKVTIKASTVPATAGSGKAGTLKLEVSPDSFTIKSEDQTISVDNGEGATTETITNELIHTDVRNLKGSLLPETGGIGTTIFYIAGGVLLVGAVVLLIAKRRTSADDE